MPLLKGEKAKTKKGISENIRREVKLIKITSMINMLRVLY